MTHAAAKGAGSRPDATYRVEMRGIHKSFGALKVLKGVDLGIAPGEVSGWSATTAPASRR